MLFWSSSANTCWCTQPLTCSERPVKPERVPDGKHLLADLEARGGLQGERPEEFWLDIDPDHREVSGTISADLQSVMNWSSHTPQWLMHSMKWSSHTPQWLMQSSKDALYFKLRSVAHIILLLKL